MTRFPSLPLALMAALACGSAAARAEEAVPAAPARAWTDEAQATYLRTTGNTRAATLGAANLFKGHWSLVSLELAGAAMGASSRGVVLAEQYSAFEKVKWNFEARTYVFERVGWDKNRFAGIADRVDASVGVGRDLLKTPVHHLILEAGGGYVDEQRVRAARLAFASGRAYSKYTLALGPTGAFAQDAEYLHNIPHPAGYRIRTETSVATAMSTHVSLKMSFTYLYANEPAKGFGKSDSLTSAALIVSL